MQTLYGSHIKRDIEIIEQVQKRATKHLPYTERLKQLTPTTLKYRRLRKDMVEIFKIVYEFYHL